jgi:hypothetical protein
VGEVEVVVGADEQVETTLVGRVGVKDAVVFTKEDAQTRELAFRERDLAPFQERARILEVVFETAGGFVQRDVKVVIKSGSEW